MLQHIGIQITRRKRSNELVTKDTKQHVYGKDFLVVISYSSKWFVKILDMSYLFCIIETIECKIGLLGEKMSKILWGSVLNFRNLASHI